MELEGFAFDDKYPQAREQLRQAVNNIDYLEYAAHEGPLRLHQLSDGDRLKPEVQEVIARYGWPNVRDDSIIEPVPGFSTDREFIDSLRPTTEWGPQKLISSHLFTMLLVASPNNRAGSEYITAPALGEMPVVHRAHAIAPDLFESLRVVLGEFKTRYRDPQPLAEEDFLYEAIISEENGDIPQAMHMAYRTLARLLKVSDVQTMYEGIGKTDIGPPILNADSILRYDSW